LAAAKANRWGQPPYYRFHDAHFAYVVILLL
jgi:hypothetical protein